MRFSKPSARTLAAWILAGCVCLLSTIQVTADRLSWGFQPPAGTPINLQHPQARGLVGMWMLNEGGGLSAIDATGRFFSATHNGDAIYGVGARGRHVAYGSSTGWTQLPDFSIASGEGLTITSWVRTTDTNGPIVALRNSSDGFPIFATYLGFNGLTTNSGHVIPLMRYDGGGLVEITSSQNISDGVWHLVVLSLDQMQDILRLWIDTNYYSVAQSTDGAFTFTSDVAIASERRWVRDSTATLDERYLSGDIIDVRLYRRAFTAADAMELYVHSYAIFDRPTMRGWQVPVVGGVTPHTLPLLGVR